MQAGVSNGELTVGWALVGHCRPWLPLAMLQMAAQSLASAAAVAPPGLVPPVGDAPPVALAPPVPRLGQFGYRLSPGSVFSRGSQSRRCRRASIHSSAPGARCTLAALRFRDCAPVMASVAMLDVCSLELPALQPTAAARTTRFKADHCKGVCIVAHAFRPSGQALSRGLWHATGRKLAGPVEACTRLCTPQRQKKQRTCYRCLGDVDAVCPHAPESASLASAAAL